MHVKQGAWKFGGVVFVLLLAMPLMSWAVSKKDMQRKDSRAAVTVTVTYLNPLGKVQGNTLDFEVRMNTHSVDLEGFKVEELAVLQGENGVKVKPLGWFEPGGGGHHRFGILRFPQKDEKGNRLLAGEGKKLELRIRGIAAPAERVFQWVVPR